jgi:quercetin dioxygenase-like cupin family protein
MPVPEAKLVEKSGALTPDGDGWFIVNVADALSWKHPTSGQYIAFEDKDHRFPHYGIGIHVVWPGQASAMYHAESNQESFMVLEGECRLIVEGEERIMRKWDFFHCAPMTRHITIGAGDGPCAILMVGARLPDVDLEYPHDPLAAKYGAQSPVPTGDPEVAYSEVGREWTPGPFVWPVN